MQKEVTTEVEATELELAIMDMVGTSLAAVGEKPTIQLLTTIAGLIRTKPDFAQKLASEETQKKLADLASKMEGHGELSAWDLLPLYGEIKAIFG